MALADAHDLYGLPLERFVPERTALARKLRDEGQREEGAKVGKLPKPSIAAWAVNQLVRTQGRAVSDLFDAGDALQKAQDDLVSGRSDGDALRTAAERERAAATLGEAEDALAAAHRRVKETESEHARARQELDKI